MFLWAMGDKGQGVGMGIWPPHVLPFGNMALLTGSPARTLPGPDPELVAGPICAGLRLLATEVGGKEGVRYGSSRTQEALNLTCKA